MANFLSALFGILLIIFNNDRVIQGSPIDKPTDQWTFNVKYYQSKSLQCTTGNNRYMWILPSGDILNSSSTDELVNGHYSLMDNGSVLTINRVDDADFGLYFCVTRDTSGETVVVKRGINLDGAYYGPELWARYKKSSIIGGIAAGCMFVFIVTAYVVCEYCMPSSKQNELVDIADSSDGETSKQTLDQSTLDLSVYDTADGVHARAKLVENGEARSSTIHDARLLSYESGHYHSIDELKTMSLERGADPDIATEMGGDQQPVNSHERVPVVSESTTGLPEATETSEDVFRQDETFEDTKEPNQVRQENVDTEETLIENANDKDVHVGLHADETISESSSDEQATKKSIPASSVPPYLTPAADINADEETQPIYATPTKRSVVKEFVEIVNGEVILESTGSVVVVTSSPLNTTESPASISRTSDVVNKPHQAQSSIISGVHGNDQQRPLSMAPSKREPNDVPGEHKLMTNLIINEILHKFDDPDAADDKIISADTKQAGSGVSSTTSRSPARTPSEDDESIDSSHKVKANLVIGELQNMFVARKKSTSNDDDDDDTSGQSNADESSDAESNHM